MDLTESEQHAAFRAEARSWLRDHVPDEPLPTNIGNPNEITILEFAQRVIELTGSASSIVHQDLPQDDPKVRQPDITKARRVLDWEPQVELADGLERTLAHFQGRVAEAR